MLAAPLKGVLVATVVTGTEPSEADGADGEAVPVEAGPDGIRVLLLETGYGATGTAVLSGTTGAAGAVPRSMAGVEKFATTTGAYPPADTLATRAI